MDPRGKPARGGGLSRSCTGMGRCSRGPERRRHSCHPGAEFHGGRSGTEWAPGRTQHAPGGAAIARGLRDHGRAERGRGRKRYGPAHATGRGGKSPGQCTRRSTSRYTGKCTAGFAHFCSGCDGASRNSGLAHAHRRSTRYAHFRDGISPMRTRQRQCREERWQQQRESSISKPQPGRR